MTARLMQIEFDRRWQALNPEGEISQKIDSDTIFAYINAYQLRYVKTNFLAEDNVPDGTRIQRKTADNFRTLIKRERLATTLSTTNTDGNTSVAAMPDDYFIYIRSNSIVSKTYKDASEIIDPSQYKVLLNQSISIDSASSISSGAFNKTIIRIPFVLLSENSILIIHDTRTIVKEIDLVYLREPKRVNVIGVDGVEILNECELPEQCHMEIVEGAFEMYITEYRYRTTALDNADNNDRS